MSFNEKPPKWLAAGAEPSESKKAEGWLANERPPADYWNWQMSSVYKVLTELQAKAAESSVLTAHTANTNNPHAVTAAQVGAETPAGAQAKADAVQTNLATHANNKNNPHAVTAAQVGAETPSGAQAKADAVQTNLNTHTAATTAHGSTSAATPDRIPLRDANSRFKVGAPAASDDVARKDTVDNALVMGVPRQAFINGDFRVSQRGSSFTAPAGTAISTRYTADRWFQLDDPNGGSIPTVTTTPQFTNSDGQFLRLTFSGAGSALGVNSQANISQPIEFGTRNLCGLGKKVTISFEARSNISGKKISVWAQQHYGSGGSPSSNELINGKSQVLTSSFQTFSYTFTTIDLAGKVFGSNNDDHLRIRIGYMWGSGLASLNGDTVAETYRGAGNVDIRNVQVNAGDTALPFQPRSYGEELALCQRYCYVPDCVAFSSIIGVGTASFSNTAAIAIPLPVQMRTVPSLVATPSEWMLGDVSNAGQVLTSISKSTGSTTKTGVVLDVISGSTLTQYRPYFLLSNGSNKKMIFDAEL